MLTRVKREVARAALRWELRAFLTHPNRFNVLLGHAVRLQCGEISEEAFRQELDRFYAGLDRSRLLEELDFASQVQELNRPRGYKIAVSQLREPSDPGSDLQRA